MYVRIKINRYSEKQIFTRKMNQHKREQIETCLSSNKPIMLLHEMHIKSDLRPYKKVQI
jgi:hypothetical protein